MTMPFAQCEESTRPGSAETAIEVSAAGEIEWDDYVRRHPESTVDHMWGWRTVFTAVFGQRCEYLAARRAERVVGVLPLVLFDSRLFGRFVVSLPYLNYGGLLTDDTAAADALVERAAALGREFGATHVELRHRQRQFPSLPVRQHKVGLSLELPQTAAAHWNQLDRKVRNQVRKAQKANLTTIHGGVELVDEFYQVFSRNMRDLGTPVYSKRLFRVTLEQFPAQASIVVVRHGTQPVASAVAVSFRETTLVPWASALRDFRQLCPNMLLYWQLLQRAVDGRMRTFDFGRSSPGGGTHQFKLQWGAREEPLCWEYKLLAGEEPPNQGPTNPRFAVAIELWKKLPLWLADACGPFIAKNLP